MKFLLFNTGNYDETLSDNYIDSLLDNNIILIEEGNKYYININTIEELMKIKEIVREELIISNIYDFEKDKTPKIEIYDDYRE